MARSFSKLPSWMNCGDDLNLFNVKANLLDELNKKSPYHFFPETGDRYKDYVMALTEDGGFIRIYIDLSQDTPVYMLKEVFPYTSIDEMIPNLEDGWAPYGE